MEKLNTGALTLLSPMINQNHRRLRSNLQRPYAGTQNNRKEMASHSSYTSTVGYLPQWKVMRWTAAVKQLHECNCAIYMYTHQSTVTHRSELRKHMNIQVAATKFKTTAWTSTPLVLYVTVCWKVLPAKVRAISWQLRPIIASGGCGLACSFEAIIRGSYLIKRRF